MEIKKIYACWTYVSNLNKAIHFFKSIGLRIKLIEDNWAEFDLGETSFAILERPLEKGKLIPRKTRIMFEVNNIQETYNNLINNKVKIIGDIRNESYGKLLTFEDIDGNWFEIFENKKTITI